MSRYPALVDLGRRRVRPLGDGPTFLVGRADEADLRPDDATLARFQFRLVRTGDVWTIEPIPGPIPTRLDGVPITEPRTLQHRAVLEAGNSRFCFLARADPAVVQPRATDALPTSPQRDRLVAQETTLDAAGWRGLDGPPDAWGDRFPLTGDALLGRDPARVDLALPHSLVSRVHARIVRRAGRVILTDLASANGTFVNGQAITAPTALEPGDRIDIGPYSLVFDGSDLLPHFAVLLVLLFGDLTKLDNPVERAQRTTTLLFLLGVSSLWLGCNNAAKEIVKERRVYAQERAFSLRLGSYFAAKFLLLLALVAGQTLLLAGLTSGLCQPEGAFLGTYLILLLLGEVGVALGLVVSAVATTEDQAVTLVPVVLIPQIILGGFVAPVSGVSEFLARNGIAAYEGQEALTALLSEVTLQAVGQEAHSPWPAVGVLGLHLAVLVAAGVLLLALGGRGRRSGFPA